MIRAGLLLLTLIAPAEAATLDDCEALTARLPVDVGKSEQIAGVCLFSDVRFGDAPAAWRAERVTLSGDIDALPDALPARLSGGIYGLTPDREVPGFPGMAWLMREQAHPGMSVTFDTTASGGVLRVNSFVFRLDETNEIFLTARIAGLPEVWPVDPIASAAVQLQSLNLELVFDGMFESLFLLPLGPLLIDTTQEAEPQVAALRQMAKTFLDAFAGTDQSENAAQAQAFLDALPHPRGVLEFSIGGTGLAAPQVITLAKGQASPDFIGRVAAAAELDIFWEPSAP